MRVPEIDGDHRAILGLMNAVRSTAAAGNRERVDHYLERLLALSKAHFAREEALLERWGYPEAKTHATYHARLLQRAKTLHQTCAQIESAEAFEECCEELMSFLVDDVVGGDMKLKSFFEASRLTLPS